MRVDLVPAAPEDRGVLENLMQLYLYELSDLEGVDVDPQGRFPYPFLDLYGVEEGRHAFLIRAGGAIAGFALVNRHTVTGAQRAIAEFFVLKRYRRRGIGGAVARQLFDRFAGSWEIRTRPGNDGARAFWRDVIRGYTHGQYEEAIGSGGAAGEQVFTFTSGGGP